MKTTTNHPDFLRALTPAQVKWLASVGIKATPAADYFFNGKARRWESKPRGWGFSFSKAGMWIEPIAANHRGSISVLESGAHLPEGNDGEPVYVESFETLRDALRFLASQVVTLDPEDQILRDEEVA